MRLFTLFPPVIAAFLLAGCIATAPVTFAWRSNTSQQHATTDGRTVKASDANTVNADRTTENQAAVTTGSGNAGTAEQTASLPEDAPARDSAVIPAPEGTEAVR